MKHINYLTITLLTLLSVTLYTVPVLARTTYFSCDFENGYQYINARHPGGGYFYLLGGYAAGPEGTGNSATNTYHNTVISSDSNSQGTVSGSTHALKTPYLGVCPNEATIRDTTIINLSSQVYEYYIRWYQKWTGDWNSADVQHKFFKPEGPTVFWAGQFSFPPRTKWFRAYIPNLEGRFNKDGIARSSGWIWVTQRNGGAYSGCNISYDDINNGIGTGGTDENFVFQTNRWYCIEIHAKVNTNASTADAVCEAWVDGKQIFGVYNFKYFNSGTRPGINSFEMQHIYYNRSSTNQPTYMDNIVISDQYIGPVTSVPADTTSPTSPSGITINLIN